MDLDKNDHAQFIDEHHVVHYVGHHRGAGTMRCVYTECDKLIGNIEPNYSFYGGNICGFVTCIECLVHSNFGTYAPR